MKGRRQVKEGFISLETIATWIVYVCHSEGEWASPKIEVPLNWVVGARRTGLCQELQRCWVFHGQKCPVCIKNDPPLKGHPANLTQLWEALQSKWASSPMEPFQHMVESMPRRIVAVLRANVLYTQRTCVSVTAVLY